MNKNKHIMTQDEKQKLLNGSIDMIIKYLSLEYVEKYYTELHAALSKLAENHHIIPKLFHIMYFDINDFPNINCTIKEKWVTLLYDYINMSFNGKYKVTNIKLLMNLNDEYKSFLIPLIRKEYIADIVNVVKNDYNDSSCVKSIFESFIQNIMDVYVPSYFTTISNEFNQLIMDNPDEFIANLYNTNWIHDKILNDSLSEEYKSQWQLVFLYISEIYSHTEILIKYLDNLHNLYKLKFTFKAVYNDMIDRFSLYLGDKINNGSISHIINSLKKENIDSRLVQYYYDLFYSDNADCTHFLSLVNEINYFLYLNGNIDSFKYKKNDESINHELLYKLKKDENDIVAESYSTIKLVGIDYACEAFKKDSVAIKKSSDKIYRAYKAYKNAEDKVDSQVTKAVKGLGKVAIGDVRTEIIEGKQFSAIGLLKKLLHGVALFSIGPIKGAVALVVRYALKKNVTVSERKKIIMELETELELINEKINDAQGDNNRQAKYAMMRTRSELKNALERIRYGLEADSKSIAKASSVLSKAKSEN